MLGPKINPPFSKANHLGKSDTNFSAERRGMRYKVIPRQMNAAAHIFKVKCASIRTQQFYLK